MEEEKQSTLNYHKLGLQNAEKARGNPDQLESSLDVIYQIIVKEAELSSEQKEI